ncbi:hypothetical protein [Actinomadura sp. NPDC048394]|uniref:hypothetical protein n=1 Tax=Actinomadura sp. NPDC048394 TaxID=3158223 RepID=UPI0033E9849B
MHSPFRGHFRVTTRDTELGGVHLPARSRLMLLWGAVNRDPAAYPAPTPSTCTDPRSNRTPRSAAASTSASAPTWPAWKPSWPCAPSWIRAPSTPPHPRPVRAQPRDPPPHPPQPGLRPLQRRMTPPPSRIGDLAPEPLAGRRSSITVPILLAGRPPRPLTALEPAPCRQSVPTTRCTGTRCRPRPRGSRCCSISSTPNRPGTQGLPELIEKRRRQVCTELWVRHSPAGRQETRPRSAAGPVRCRSPRALPARRACSPRRRAHRGSPRLGPCGRRPSARCLRGGVHGEMANRCQTSPGVLRSDASGTDACPVRRGHER